MMPRLILASGSTSRKEILLAAGVSFDVIPSSVDEEAIKSKILASGGTPEFLAATLAHEKALEISLSNPDAYVLGADQLLVCEGRVFSKAGSLAEAQSTLRFLRSRKHQLIGALALLRASEPVWQHTETSELWVRDFSDAFLEKYLAAEGSVILGSVGCYRIEAMGAQLFDRVTADQFAVRGLSLLPLLGALREYGIAAP